MTQRQQEISEMSTDFTKRFKLWRLTLAVSLPGWMRLAWVFHPIRTYRELLATREAERQAQLQYELEKKWEKLFCDAFSQKKPEFEFDPKGSGRVLGLKETLAESKIPSVGVWCAGDNQGALDRAIDSSGLDIELKPAPGAGDCKHIVDYFESDRHDARRSKDKK